MTTELPDRVAGTIRAELARRSMTQTALAAAIGKDKMYVSRRLSGSTPVDIADLELIAQALGLKPADLLAEPVGSQA